MKKIIYSFLFLGMMFLMTSKPVQAAEELQRLLDEADLLTQKQEADIEERLDKISEKYDADIVIATVNSLEGNGPKKHASVMYKRMGCQKNGMILLVSMEDRDVCVRTKGDYDGYEITVFETDYILEEITSDLSDGYYKDAFSTYIDLTSECIDRDLEAEYYEENDTEYDDTTAEDKEFNDISKDFSFSDLESLILPLLFDLFVRLGLSFAIAFLIMYVMKRKLKSVKANDYAANYVKQGSMKVEKSEETFLYKNVTKSRRSNNTSGSSRSSSSRSSSSRSRSRSSGSRSRGGSSGKF